MEQQVTSETTTQVVQPQQDSTRIDPMVHEPSESISITATGSNSDLPPPSGSADSATGISSDTNLEWMLAEGVPGKGEKPDYLMDKYGNALEQAKAYPELNKLYQQKIGSFEKAPETYELTLADTLPEGADINLEDSQFKAFEELARNSNMSNQLFNDLVNIHLSSTFNQPELTEDMIQEHRTTEIKKLGDNGAAMVEQVKNWASNNFSQTEFQTITSFCNDAESVQLFHKLANMKGLSNIPSTESSKPYTGEDLRLMLADSRYSQDQNFKAKVDDLYTQMYSKSE